MDAQSSPVESCVYNDRTFFGYILVSQAFPPRITDRFTFPVETFTWLSDISLTSGSFAFVSKTGNIDDSHFLSLQFGLYSPPHPTRPLDFWFPG